MLEKKSKNKTFNLALLQWKHSLLLSQNLSELTELNSTPYWLIGGEAWPKLQYMADEKTNISVNVFFPESVSLLFFFNSTSCCSGVTASSSSFSRRVQLRCRENVSRRAAELINLGRSSAQVHTFTLIKVIF